MRRINGQVHAAGKPRPDAIRHSCSNRDSNVLMSTPLSMRGTMFRLKTAVFIFAFVTLGIAQKTSSTQTQAESPKPSGNVRFNPDLTKTLILAPISTLMPVRSGRRRTPFPPTGRAGAASMNCRSEGNTLFVTSFKNIPRMMRSATLMSRKLGTITHPAWTKASLRKRERAPWIAI